MHSYLKIVAAISCLAAGTLSGNYYQEQNWSQANGQPHMVGNNSGTTGYQPIPEGSFTGSQPPVGEFYKVATSDMQGTSFQQGGNQFDPYNSNMPNTLPNNPNPNSMPGNNPNMPTNPNLNTMRPVQGAPGSQGLQSSPRTFNQGNPQAYNNQPTNGRAASMDKAMKMSMDNDKYVNDEDRRLGFQIRQQISEKSPGIDLSGVSLYIDDGSVRIIGRVRSDQERTDLSNMIKEIKGVKSLNNKVEISSNAKSPLAYGDSPRTGTYSNSPMGPGSPSGPANPKGPIGPNNYPSNSMSQFPNSTSNWPNTNATNMNNVSLSGQDTMLSDKIRSAISSDTNFSPQVQNIGITVSSGTITLNGTVRTESEKNRVAAKVRDLSEGRRVNNMLEVSPTAR